MTSDLPEGAGHPSDGGHGHAISVGNQRVAVPGRVPWRSVGVGVMSVGTPLGTGMMHPLLGGVMVVVELVVILTVLGTALFGSKILSERAFRLLRWIGNRPEPPRPGEIGTPSVGRPPGAADNDHE